jgi:hypothetical protein
MGGTTAKAAAIPAAASTRAIVVDMGVSSFSPKSS